MISLSPSIERYQKVESIELNDDGQRMKRKEEEEDDHDKQTKKRKTEGRVMVRLETKRSCLWTQAHFTRDMYDELKDLVLEIEPPNMMYGKTVRQRRDIGFFSDASAGYRYSGQIMVSKPLSSVPALASLLKEVNATLDTSFNGILVNRYADGTKYIGAHSDDERDLDKSGKNRVASIAYGPGIRTFRIRRKTDKTVVLNYRHEPCTLVVMEGAFQQEFTHEVPIEKKVREPRISVTFRHHTQ